MSTASESRRRRAAGAKPLTPRQVQVITGLLAGLGYKEIAAKLNISPRCVKFHAGEIYRGYGVHGRENLLLKFGRFEIDVRWVAIPETERAAGAFVNPAIPGLPLPRPDYGLGGTR